MNQFQNTDDLFTPFKRESERLTLIGMLKEGQTSTTVMYSPNGCDSWIEIEKSAIFQVDYLNKIPCVKPGEAPHLHPLVRLYIDAAVIPDAAALRVIATLVTRRRKIVDSGSVKGLRDGPPSTCGEGATGWSACGGTATCDGQLVQAADNERVFWNSEMCWLEGCPECG